MYNHPFTVSKVMGEVEVGIIKMHREMKDIALASNNSEINDSVQKIDNLENEIVGYFDLLDERFLGDKSDIEALKIDVINWKPIRDEVITLSLQAKFTEASQITKEKGVNHVSKILTQVHDLTVFAEEKATIFYQNSEKKYVKVYYYYWYCNGNCCSDLHFGCYDYNKSYCKTNK